MGEGIREFKKSIGGEEETATKPTTAAEEVKEK
jgi:Sec-independent protein translocase protein TatA